MLERRVSVKHGRIAYNVVKGDQPTVIFIHNLSSNKDWLIQGKELLPGYTWLVPDLIGIGKSSRSHDAEAFEVERQAEDLLELIKNEGVKDLVIIGHGSGGLVGQHLASILDRDVNICLLLHIMTYLDSQDIVDNYGRKDYGEYLEQYNYDITRYKRINTPAARMIVNHLQKIDPFSIWATYNAMEKYLEHDLIAEMSALPFPIHYLVAEAVRGSMQSEKLMKKTQYPVSFIPDTHANPHLENPRELWRYLKEQIDDF